MKRVITCVSACLAAGIVFATLGLMLGLVAAVAIWMVRWLT